MKIKNPVSKTTLIVIYLALIVIWHWLLNLYGESLTDYNILTWDVFGYYVYLPAIFDFHDLHHLKFVQDIIHQNPSLAVMYYDAVHNLPNGNFVIKYSCGNAVMYSPFYFIAKVWAKVMGYPRNGLSLPYQVSMIFCGFFYAFAGLLVLRKVLINFFSDTVTAFVLVAVALATNYVEYSTYTSLLTHNILFFIYACVLLATIRLYKNFSYKNSALLGILLGIAPLIRPTEMVAVFIPLLYGVQNLPTLFNKIKSLSIYYKKVIVIAFITGMIGSIQLIYWKKVSGKFFVYSYYDQSFDFTSPHFYYGMFSTTNGWLVYTPIMFFALIGIYFCYRQFKFLFWAMLVYVFLHMYFTFSWQMWWYGSSFGQRAMIQSYPMLSIALGCLVNVLFKKKYKIIISLLVLMFFIWLNILQTYQAHEGIINISHMNDRYFLKIFGKSHISNKEYKFWDTDEELDSSHIQSSNSIYHRQFAAPDSSVEPNPDTLEKNTYCLLLGSNQTFLALKNNLGSLQLMPGDWITVSFEAYIKNISFNMDQMPYIHARVSSLKYRSIKISDKIGNNDRYNFNPWGHAGTWDRLTFDFMIPKNATGADSIFVSFSNPNKQGTDGQDVYLNDIWIYRIKTK